MLDVDQARRSGVSSISELLQQTTVSNGQQINGNAGASNASEPPPIGGVGSADISLRGLGSSGVRGAPAQPDINLIPMNLVSNVETASAPYTAEAPSVMIWYHDVSGTYYFDETFYVTAGVNNVADKRPALVSAGAGYNRLNRVTSSGYDQFGRTYFLSLTKSL